ncbi:hypothetical protein O9992_08180 [Vibrio lentus]|nr:hypothetical protein [Vibrio lentus]
MADRSRGLPYSIVNQKLGKKQISTLLNECYRKLGLKDTVVFADQIMYAGFACAALSRCFCWYRRYGCSSG